MENLEDNLVYQQKLIPKKLTLK